MGSNSLNMSTLIRLISGLVALLGCYFFVKAVMIWMYPDSAVTIPEASATTVQTSTPNNNTPSLDYNFDPFYPDGAPVELGEIEPLAPTEDAEETNLNVKLKGTTAPDLAIIEGSDRKQKNYGIGDEITNGVTLDSVYAGYVILLRDGNREKLSLEKTSSGLTESSSAPVPFRGAVRGGATVNPSELLNRVSVTPHLNNNKMVGYKIESQPGFDIKPLGFRNGDIITRLGSQDLTQDGIDFNTTVISAIAEGNPTAQIMRRGRKMTIRIRMP